MEIFIRLTISNFLYIIILLILAGISIAALTNQGLFNQAQNAKNVTEEKTAEEKETLRNYEEQINAITQGTYNKNEIVEKSIIKVGTTKEFAVDSNYKIEKIINENEEIARGYSNEGKIFIEAKKDGNTNIKVVIIGNSEEKTINYNITVMETEWQIDYKADEQKFIAPCKGTYNIQLWGASGGKGGQYYEMIIPGSRW